MNAKQAKAATEARRDAHRLRDAALMAEVDRLVTLAEDGKPEGFVHKFLISTVIRTAAYQNGDAEARKLADRAAIQVGRYNDTAVGDDAPAPDVIMGKKR